MYVAESSSTWFCLWTGSSLQVALHPAGSREVHERPDVQAADRAVAVEAGRELVAVEQAEAGEQAAFRAGPPRLQARQRVAAADADLVPRVAAVPVGFDARGGRRSGTGDG